MNSCPRCGSMAGADVKFCTACGAHLAAPEPPAAPASIGWNCVACGARWDVNIRFCMKCGAARPGSEELAAPVPPVPPVPVARAPRQGVNPWLVVAALALLVAGAGASGYLLYKRYWSGAPAAAQPQQTAQAAPEPAPQAAPPVSQETPPPAQEPAAEAAPVPSPVAEQPEQPPAAPPHVTAPEPVRRSARPAPLKPAPIAQPTQPSTEPPAPVTVQPAEPPRPEVAPPERRPPERVEMVKPEPQSPPPATPAKPAYSGPSTGTILWSGKLAKDILITIDGRSASVGSVNGELPGVPVILDVQPADVGVAEAPSPANGWKRIVLRSRVNRGTVVTIRWWLLR